LSGLKKLAGDTVIYGASSIVARFLNWFLTPIYTYNFVKAEFGILSNIPNGMEVIPQTKAKSLMDFRP
jgi:hypothetical protein